VSSSEVVIMSELTGSQIESLLTLRNWSCTDRGQFGNGAGKAGERPGAFSFLLTDGLGVSHDLLGALLSYGCPRRPSLRLEAKRLPDEIEEAQLHLNFR
jgi:hypothetical protein